MAQFVLTERGGRKLIFNGFGYTKKRENKTGITWRCDTSKCRWKLGMVENGGGSWGWSKTAVEVGDGGIVEEMGTHTHELNAAKFEVLQAKNNLKRKAAESLLSSSAVVSEVMGTVSRIGAVHLPKASSLQRLVRMNRASNFAPMSDTVDELVIPEQFEHTLDGDQFLWMDESYGVGRRICVFCTRSSREIMKVSSFWMMDGTFSVAPKLFTQLYTIHALVAGESIPTMYVLLTDKTKDSYKWLLKNLVEGWHRRFQTLVNCDHPSVWKLLEIIQQEQRYTERRYDLICAGRGTPRDAKYDAIDARLKHCVTLFGTIPFGDYLKGIAANF